MPTYDEEPYRAQQGFGLSIIHDSQLGWDETKESFLRHLVTYTLDNNATAALPVRIFHWDDNNDEIVQTDGAVAGMDDTQVHLQGGVSIDIDDIISFHI